MKINKDLWACIFLIGSIFFFSCSDDDNAILDNGNEELKQPDNIIVSLVSSGLQDIIDIETTPSLQFNVERNVNARETIALFSALSKEEIESELSGNEPYSFLAKDKWEIKENPVIFVPEETMKSVIISFVEPPRTNEPQIFLMGLYLRSFTAEADIESTKSKIIFRVKVPAKEGTKTNPYLLRSIDDLLAMKSKINAIENKEEIYFELQNDIDMGGSPWTPLVNTTTNLDWDGYKVIHLNGNSHTISNWVCEGQPYASFFGILIGSCKDINFENAKIAGIEWPVGIVAGAVGHFSYAPKTHIINTHVSGSVSGEYNQNWSWNQPRHAAGGICGVLRQGSSIENSSSLANVDGTTTGGIVGDCNNNGGEISSCFANGTIKSVGTTGISYAGGIVGNIGNGCIVNCYSQGNIIGNGAGGIAGNLFSDISITNSYTTAKVEANGNAGGIVGRAESDNNTIVKSIAWNNSVSSANDVGSGLITGWTKGNNLKFQNCYVYENTVFSALGNTDKSGYDADIVGNTDGTLRYNGKTAIGSLTETAIALGWSNNIWDFSGAEPKLK